MRDHGQTYPKACTKVLWHTLHPGLRRERTVASRAFRDQGAPLRYNLHERDV